VPSQSAFRSLAVVVTAAEAVAATVEGAEAMVGSGGDGGGGTTVDMTDELVYEPETLTVSVGDTVTWENVGSIGHSVTAYEDEIPDGAEYFASGGFDSEQAAKDAYAPGDTDAGDIPGGESWEHTFETAGTYEYFCIPHEQAGMVGTIEVQE
jgi:plastocyanin